MKMKNENIYIYNFFYIMYNTMYFVFICMPFVGKMLNQSNKYIEKYFLAYCKKFCLQSLIFVLVFCMFRVFCTYLRC